MEEKEGLMVTVAMVTYNSAKYLRQAIESILNSDYKNFELLICDDKSSDESWKIINSYNDPRIRRFLNKVNLGEYPNRNQCISLAKGSYLIFIDGDDILYPHGLGYLVSQLNRRENIGMVLGHGWKEQIIFPCLVTPVDFYRSVFLGKSSLLALNFTKILFNTECLRNNGGVGNDFKTGDTYIQGKIGKNHQILLVSEGFSWWRRRPDQASEKVLKNGTAVAEHFNYFYLFLNSHDCPLSYNEKNIAKRNHYGNFSRYLLRLLLKGNIFQFIRLYKVSGFPIEGWNYVLKSGKRNFYFSNVS